MSNDLNKKFNLTPIDPEKNSVGPLNVDSEYHYVRKNTIANIERSLIAIDDLADLAKSSQNARTYEVLNQMLKTVNDLGKDLLEIKKQETEKADNDKDKVASPVTINQLTITTNQLLDMMENAKKNQPPKSSIDDPL